MNRILFALVLTALGGTAVAAPPAGGFEDIAALEARVVAALDADIGTPGGPNAPIDRRVKLAKCPVTVTIDPPALGAVALRCPALGWRLRVPLKTLASAPQQAAAVVKVAPVIKRGDPVELVAQTGTITVSTQAVAQEDGVPGGRIRVKSEGKAEPVVGEVVSTGVVRVPTI